MELSKLSNAAVAAQAADEQANVRQRLAVFGVVVVLAVGIYFLFLRTPAPPSLESLTTAALTAGDAKERERAAAMLGHESRGPESIRLFRQIAAQSKDPAVLAIAIQSLDRLGDAESLPQFFVAMEHEDAKVRAAGWQAARRLAMARPSGTAYSPSDPPEKRKEAVRELRKAQERALEAQREAAKKKGS